MTSPSQNCPSEPDPAVSISRLYAELRILAARRMAGEAPGQTLQATALVHEAWLRLGADHQPPWRNRAHFFAAAGEAMRRVLIDRARARHAARRGGGVEALDLDSLELAVDTREDVLLALDDALARLAVQHPAKADLVKLRFFGGQTLEEAGRLLGLSEATTKRHWAFARAWLYREMVRNR